MGNTLKLELAAAPPIGLVHEDDGFRYVVVGSRDHVNRDGSPSCIVTWEGTCAEGGEPFRFVTGARIYGFNRRCKDHYKGWTRAKPFTGKAVAVTAPEADPRVLRAAIHRALLELGKGMGTAERKIVMAAEMAVMKVLEGPAEDDVAEELFS